MKTRLVQFLISILKYTLRFIYFFLKLLPTNKQKVVFCSRQSNEIPLDFILIQEELAKRDKAIKSISICKHISNNLCSYIKYIAGLFKSMYHIATGSICIIDSYWPAVSLLNHKKGIIIMQLWHSIGKVKQSGYQTVGKKSGRKIEYAKALNMHGNYDYIIAGSKIWNKFYCESFNTTEDKLLNFGLPRIDYLLNTEQKNRCKFFMEHPEWTKRKVVLYAPTFRKNMKAHWQSILDAAEDENFILIIKKHPGQEIHISTKATNVVFMEDWDTIDLLAVCDALITDYSAIAIEAAVLKKRTYYWVYDYEQYMQNNGLNIGLYEQFPGYVFSDINELFEKMQKEEIGNNMHYTYPRKYLPDNLGSSTKQIVDLVIELMNRKVNGQIL